MEKRGEAQQLLAGPPTSTPRHPHRTASCKMKVRVKNPSSIKGMGLGRDGVPRPPAVVNRASFKKDCPILSHPP